MLSPKSISCWPNWSCRRIWISLKEKWNSKKILTKISVQLSGRVEVESSQTSVGPSIFCIFPNCIAVILISAQKKFNNEGWGFFVQCNVLYLFLPSKILLKTGQGNYSTEVFKFDHHPFQRKHYIPVSIYLAEHPGKSKH